MLNTIVDFVEGMNGLARAFCDSSASIREFAKRYEDFICQARRKLKVLRIKRYSLGLTWSEAKRMKSLTNLLT